jgi:hypothetical protein
MFLFYLSYYSLSAFHTTTRGAAPLVVCLLSTAMMRGRPLVRFFSTPQRRGAVSLSPSSSVFFPHSDDEGPSPSSASFQHHDDEGLSPSSSVSFPHNNDEGPSPSSASSQYHDNEGPSPSSASSQHHVDHPLYDDEGLSPSSSVFTPRTLCVGQRAASSGAYVFYIKFKYNYLLNNLE